MINTRRLIFGFRLWELFGHQGTSGNLAKSSGLLKKKWTRQRMKFTMRAMKTYPLAQTLGFFDVELRVPIPWRFP